MAVLQVLSRSCSAGFGPLRGAAGCISSALSGAEPRELQPAAARACWPQAGSSGHGVGFMGQLLAAQDLRE